MALMAAEIAERCVGPDQMQTNRGRDLSGTLVGGAVHTDTPRILALPQGHVGAFILDVDSTIYTNPAYRRDVATRETNAIADAMGWPQENSSALFQQRRDGLTARLGRPARVTETIKDLGLTQTWWDTTRADTYRPSEFLSADPTISAMLRSALERRKPVAFASNSPTLATLNVLEALGVDHDILTRILVAGPDTLGVSKPDPRFFGRTAEKLGVAPEHILSIGDDEQNDGHPAVEAGMGAAIVSGPTQLHPLVDAVLHEEQYSPFDLDTFGSQVYNPGEIQVVGFTGRAGAGKTTTAQKLHGALSEAGIPSAILSLDAFFRMSSGQRKAWLEEGKTLGVEEYARRADQMSWWDFDMAAEALSAIREGRSVEIDMQAKTVQRRRSGGVDLVNIYNRADKGELTGAYHIDPDPKEGMVVIVEGVATAHLKRKGDIFVYINAHPVVRKDRILGRDQHRAGAAAQERFGLTQAFEGNYFPKHAGNIDHVVDNSNGQLVKVPFVPHL